MLDSILWLHPPIGPSPSGGDLFLLELAAFLGEGEIRPRECRPEALWGEVTEAIAAGRVPLLDSLYLRCPPSVLSRLPRDSYLWLIHSLPWQELGGVPSLEQLGALRGAAGLIATGEAVARDLTENWAPGRPVRVCEPGIRSALLPETEEWLRDPEAGRILTLAAGRRAKGLMEGLKALEQLAFEGFSFQWRIAGGWGVDPIFEMEFRNALKESSIGSRVQLLGHLSGEEIREELERAQLVFHPSQTETFGMAVAEARTWGVPVVGTRVGILPQRVVQGRDGWLAEVGDIAGMVDGLRRALASEFQDCQPFPGLKFKDTAWHLKSAIRELRPC